MRKPLTKQDVIDVWAYLKQIPEHEWVTGREMLPADGVLLINILPDDFVHP